MKRHRDKALREKGWPHEIEDFWIGFEKFLHVLTIPKKETRDVVARH
jgi:hypothetical protein